MEIENKEEKTTTYNKYSLGQLVYLKTDKDQCLRQVIGILTRSSGVYSYDIACGPISSWHQEIEISVEKNFFILI